MLLGGEAKEGSKHEYGPGDAQQDFILDDVNCQGDEEKLTDCEFKRTHNCEQHETAGVKCEKGRLHFLCFC